MKNPKLFIIRLHQHFLDKFSSSISKTKNYHSLIMTWKNLYLNNQGSILGCARQRLCPVLWIPAKYRWVEHRGVAQVSPMSSAQQSPGQFACIYHRCQNVSGWAQYISPNVYLFFVVFYVFRRAHLFSKLDCKKVFGLIEILIIYHIIEKFLIRRFNLYVILSYQVELIIF